MSTRDEIFDIGIIQIAFPDSRQSSNCSIVVGLTNGTISCKWMKHFTLLPSSMKVNNRSSYGMATGVNLMFSTRAEIHFTYAGFLYNSD